MSSIISKLINLAGNITGILPVAHGGTGVATSTGSTSVVLSNSPTLVTPVLGVATATSINKMAVTAPATSSTLAVADGKTFTASNTLTLAGTDSTTMTFPSSSSTVMTLASADTKTGTITLSGAFVDGSGSTSGIKVETARASPTNADTQNVYSGTYTPTWANSSNTSSLSPDVHNWYRVGQMVTVSGSGTFNNAGGTLTFTITLPIAITGTFASRNLAAGSGSIGGSNNTSWAIEANTGGSNVICTTVGAANNGALITYQFTYKLQ